MKKSLCVDRFLKETKGYDEPYCVAWRTLTAVVFEGSMP